MVTRLQLFVADDAVSSQIAPPGALTLTFKTPSIVSNHRNPGSAFAGAEELIKTGGPGEGIVAVMSIQLGAESPLEKPQILRVSFMVSYHNAPCTGFPGGAALKYTGAEVDVGTLTAIHWTPVHFHDLSL